MCIKKEVKVTSWNSNGGIKAIYYQLFMLIFMVTFMDTIMIPDEWSINFIDISFRSIHFCPFPISKNRL